MIVLDHSDNRASPLSQGQPLTDGLLHAHHPGRLFIDDGEEFILERKRPAESLAIDDLHTHHFEIVHICEYSSHQDLFIRTLAADGSNKTVLYFDDTQEFGFSLNLKGRPMNAMAFKGEIIHYNMVILLAMILASPGLGYRKRLKKGF